MSNPKRIAAADLDLSEFIRPGDQIISGQASGEPVTLTEALVAQRATIGPVSVFLGLCLSESFQPAHADHIEFRSFGPMGASRALAKAGVLDISPIHYGQIHRYIEDGQIGCDVAFVLLSPPGPDGRHGFGLINDYIRSAMAKARVVIAEVNDQVPWVHAEGSPDMERITAIIETSRPPLTAAPARIGPVDEVIGRNVARYIEDGATLQIGMGAIPEAVARAIGDRRDLGFHSGMAGDFVVDLIEAGVITNARKAIDAGVSVTAVLLGRDKLYRFAERNPLIKLRPSWHTHDGDLHCLERFCQRQFGPGGGPYRSNRRRGDWRPDRQRHRRSAGSGAGWSSLTRRSLDHRPAKHRAWRHGQSDRPDAFGPSEHGQKRRGRGGDRAWLGGSAGPKPDRAGQGSESDRRSGASERAGLTSRRVGAKP